MPGVIAGRYRVTENSGAGAMGSVYVCVDERLDRVVALKALRDNLSRDPLFVERFRREARAAAALSHPNIAQVYDYGVTEDDLHYIVMELAPGQDLARLLTSTGPLDPERATNIARQIATALGVAHARGIVHRDIKPANVIVDRSDHVKVTDFGIARARDDATLTASGVIMGTVQYLSPEQATGEPARPSSDVYSLGIVLFEMLTGSVPFTADSAVAVALAHADGRVPRVRERLADIPSELDEVVARATHRDPARRFRDGAAFAAALKDGDVDPAATAPLIRTAQLPLPNRTRTLSLPGLARGAAIAIAILAGLAILLALYRAASSDGTPTSQAVTTPPARDPVEATPSPSETPSPSPSPSFTAEDGILLPESIIGDNVKDWEKRLKDEGIDVHKEKVDNEEFAKDAIIATSPGPGSFVTPGDTVTLTYSSGKEPKDEDEEDEDE